MLPHFSTYWVEDTPFTIFVIDVPQLKLAVCGSAHKALRVEKLDIRNGLLVAAENVQRGLGVPEVVVVNAVVGGAEGEVVAAGRVELDTTDIRLRFQCRHRVSNISRPDVKIKVHF